YGTRARKHRDGEKVLRRRTARRDPRDRAQKEARRTLVRHSPHMRERKPLPSMVAKNARPLEPYPKDRDVDSRRVIMKILRVQVPDQRSDRWCWAAVTVAIAR